MLLKNPLKVATENCNCEALSEEDKFKRLNEILDLYKDQKGNLISALYVAQGIFGYLPKDVIKFVAKKLNQPLINVLGVVSFYSFFSRNPKGKYTIKVCLGTACYVRGGKTILERLEKDLKIRVGETTKDGVFSLDIVRCVGACALAPVMVVANDTHRRMKVNNINAILDGYRGKAGITIGGEEDEN
jgi:NADH:ubiquinone oxidoreductase subunit E